MKNHKIEEQPIKLEPPQKKRERVGYSLQNVHKGRRRKSLPRSERVPNENQGVKKKKTRQKLK